MAGETGWVRSPAWNNERNIGSVGADSFAVVEADAVVIDPTSGKLERKAGLTTAEVALAMVAADGVAPNAAIAVRVVGELAAPAYRAFSTE